MAEINENRIPKPHQTKPKQSNIEFHPLSMVRSPANKAATYCDLMSRKDAPHSFIVNVLNQLKRWKLVDQVDISRIISYEESDEILSQAKSKAEKEEPEFIQAFNENPWNYNKSVEGEYKPEELSDKFPRAIELQKILPENLHFLFRAEPAASYLHLIIREDGKRQVLIITESDRNIDDINQDAKNAPSIIPKLEAVKFTDGQIGLLIDWIDGHPPTNSEERALCLRRAEDLLQVPMNSYDLWPGNFLIIQDKMNGNSIPYYIDSDVPKVIAQKGLSPETSTSRQEIFYRDRAKMG
jgi:hypothetical protein